MLKEGISQGEWDAWMKGNLVSACSQRSETMEMQQLGRALALKKGCHGRVEEDNLSIHILRNDECLRSTMNLLVPPEIGYY